MKPFPSESKPPSSDECASIVLDVVPTVMQLIRMRMRGSGPRELSVPHFRSLGFLTRKRGRSISELAEHIGLSLPSASKIVQSLMTRGYLQRTEDPTDRRRTILVPTSKGEKIVSQARASTRAMLSEQMTGLDADQRQMVVRAMQALQQVFITDLPEKAMSVNGANKRTARHVGTQKTARA